MYIVNYQIYLDTDCVVVNGYFPSLTIKSILTSISEDILELDSTFSSNPEHLEAIFRDIIFFGQGLHNRYSGI